LLDRADINQLDNDIEQLFGLRFQMRQAMTLIISRPRDCSMTCWSALRWFSPAVSGLALLALPSLGRPCVIE
jgi:hypothetical protein